MQFHDMVATKLHCLLQARCAAAYPLVRTLSTTQQARCEVPHQAVLDSRPSSASCAANCSPVSISVAPYITLVGGCVLPAQTARLCASR